MKVVGRNVLDTFCREHADARAWVTRWLAEVEAASWSSPQDIREQYASCSFLSDNVVIFNVRGNNYRLEVAVAYKTRVVVVKWVGTHAEYDRRHR